jgi:hypothetical protein
VVETWLMSRNQVDLLWFKPDGDFVRLRGVGPNGRRVDDRYETLIAVELLRRARVAGYVEVASPTEAYVKSWIY